MFANNIFSIHNMSLVFKNSSETELAFQCVQKLSGTHIPCLVSYLSFQNQTSKDKKILRNK